jgi:hypothetical protein
MNFMYRDLSMTLRSLRASGIEAGSEATAEGKVRVWLTSPLDGVCESALFYELGEAAEWLSARAAKIFPESDFAKVLRMLAAAVASARSRITGRH